MNFSKGTHKTKYSGAHFPIKSQSYRKNFTTHKNCMGVDIQRSLFYIVKVEKKFFFSIKPH